MTRIRFHDTFAHITSGREPLTSDVFPFPVVPRVGDTVWLSGDYWTVESVVWVLEPADPEAREVDVGVHMRRREGHGVHRR